MLKRRIGSAFVVIGAVLILSALLLLLYNENESRNAGAASDAALSILQEAMTDYQLSIDEAPTNPTESASEPSETIPEPTELTYVEINGHTYIGYLSIPTFELDLPIMGSLSGEKLQIAPCLQYGSPLSDDAVIAGHNYKHHFLPLHDIVEGEQVYFVDMSGYVIEYSVSSVKTVNPTSVDEVVESEHDLVLYTCTTGGQARVAVFCDRTELPKG